MIVTREDVQKFIENQFVFDSINESKSLIDDLIFDSLMIVSLEIELEKKFEIEISEFDVENWVTVKDVIDSVMSRL